MKSAILAHVLPRHFAIKGIKLRSDDHAPCYDYDGEFQQCPASSGRQRVHAGYFGLGPILRAPENPNADVIPGNIYRMGDLLFSIVVRATEYALKKRK